MAERPQILICSCEDTMPLDAESVRRGCRGSVSTAHHLCRAEIDKYKSVQARGTVTVWSHQDSNMKARLSGFYSYGWYAKDRPRNVGIVMASFESPHVVATGQYLQATDNPFVVNDVERQGMSIFGEARMGEKGWAGFGRVLFFT